VSEQPQIVYHMLPKATWDALPPGGAYAAQTLATEGFVHCTAEPNMLEVVANRFYRAQPGEWLILSVNLAAVAAPVRWEQADGHLFPHIYGVIERSAIQDVKPFPRSPDGAYHLPEDGLCRF
jgi:uncharacterized protein (DUF952 family)